MSYRRHAEVKPAKAPWIEKIPVHWEERPLYAVAKERRAKNIGMKEDNLLSLSYGNIIRKDINTPNGLLPESFETYQIVEPDDVVFRLTDLQNDKRSLRSAICPERGIITSAYLAVRSEGVLPGFMNYLMRAYDVQKVFYSMGGGMRQSLGFEDLRRMSVVAPDQDEQVAIVRFLDRETGLIDGLIEKKTRFIALLKEKRAAVITHAVTKGIDPDAPMKDSGQDWIGKVPEHWDVIAAARLFDERDERSKTGDEELLTVSHITGVTPRSEKTVHMIEAESTIGYKRCLPGDLVINTLWAWMGAMGTARILGISSPAYNVYTPRRHLIDPRYIDYLVRLPVFAKEVTRFSKGVWSSRLRLYPEGLREVRFPVPPLAEQAQLADHLDQQTTRIDGLITLTERSIDLLREKRAALITAAVTGKIDVRAAV